MKKIFLLLSVITLTLQSCSSGDGENSNNNATSVSDVDGNVYQTVTICNQTWTESNLNVSKYRNGDVIPQVTDPTAWANLTTGAWCYYNNDPANGAIYGKLYNWYAVTDPRGLAPVGYHIPTDAEWTTLTTCLGGEAVAGGKMKEAGTAHWLTPNLGATNSSGFTGLPGGERSIEGSFNSGDGDSGYFWSTSETNTENSWGRGLDYIFTEVHVISSDKPAALSVRCIKD